VQRHAYPEVYRELRAHKMFAAIHDAADGLDAPLRATLAGLQQAYETEIAGINETLRRAFDEESPKAARLSIEHLKESVELNDWRPRDEDVIRARLAQRTALDERYCALLAETLGERYSALLPKPPAPRRKVVISSDDSDDVSR
jgi:hypothetical protein